MTEHDETADDAALGLPVLFIVDANPDACGATETALRRRFAPDYQVLTASSPEAGLDALARLAQRGTDVALVAVDLRLPGMGGVEFLARAHALHRSAMRALLIDMDRRGTRIPFGALRSLQQATALSRFDFWVVKGWDAPEELLYPQIQEALTTWTRTNRPRHEVFHILGERWSPRSYALRDAVARNTVPFGFYDVDSDQGRHLLQEYGVDVERLPAVICHDGSVLHQPTHLDIANALGVHTQPSSEVYDLVILGAGPAGLAAAVYGASEGLSTLVVEPQAIGGRLAQAP